MKTLLRNPLLHILMLAVLVAASILIVRGPSGRESESRIVVTATDLIHLRARFARTWQREPTPEELRNEVEGHIREEILYREALARGYDRDDMVVRRAMQQKMEMLAQSQAMQTPPTDEEVEAFFAMRRERYRRPAVVTLDHVYLNPDEHGQNLDRVSAELLERLRLQQPATPELGDWGDPIMLESHFARSSEDDLGRTFGSEFADTVVSLPVGEWSGPVRSGYGLHHVRITEFEASRLPELEEVLAKVLSDLEYETGRASKEVLFQEIAQTYQVVLDDTVRDVLHSDTR